MNQNKRKVWAERNDPNLRCGICRVEPAAVFKCRNDFALIMHLCEYHLPLCCTKCMMVNKLILRFCPYSKEMHIYETFFNLSSQPYNSIEDFPVPIECSMGDVCSLQTLQSSDPKTIQNQCIRSSVRKSFDYWQSMEKDLIANSNGLRSIAVAQKRLRPSSHECVDIPTSPKDLLTRAPENSQKHRNNEKTHTLAIDVGFSWLSNQKLLMP